MAPVDPSCPHNLGSEPSVVPQSFSLTPNDPPWRGRTLFTQLPLLLEQTTASWRGAGFRRQGRCPAPAKCRLDFNGRRTLRAKQPWWRSPRPPGPERGRGAAPRAAASTLVLRASLPDHVHSGRKETSSTPGAANAEYSKAGKNRQLSSTCTWENKKEHSHAL